MIFLYFSSEDMREPLESWLLSEEFEMFPSVPQLFFFHNVLSCKYDSQAEREKQQQKTHRKQKNICERFLNLLGEKLNGLPDK